MFDSEILEVAIGLFFVYTLISLLCSSFLEWIRGVWPQWKDADAIAATDKISKEKAIEKVKVQISPWLFLLGLLASCAMNVDTIAITRALYEDDALRARVVSAAENLSTETEACLQALESTPPQPLPEGCGPIETYRLLQTQLETPKFPIGWTDEQWGNLINEVFFNANGSKRAGWLVTAMAVSLGAPFWHDVLKHVLKIRKPPTE